MPLNSVLLTWSNRENSCFDYLSKSPQIAYLDQHLPLFSEIEWQFRMFPLARINLSVLLNSLEYLAEVRLRVRGKILCITHRFSVV